MTNRTEEWDNRVLKQGTGGPYRIGPMYYKTQTGGNSPTDHSKENAYSMNLVQSNDVEIQRVVYRPDGTVQSSGTSSMVAYGYSASWLGDPTWSTDDEYALLSKLTSKIRDHQFNLAVFGAEARSSLEMVTESALRIAKAFRYVKRGDITRAARALGAKKPGKVYKDAGNNWLELQYGWLPLVSDAFNAGEAIASVLNQPQRIEFRQRRKKDVGIAPTQAFNTGTGIVQKQVVARMSEDYSAISSLGLDDPLTVAWELLPYSFVADWFLPIGDFLDYRSVMGKTKATFIVTLTTKRSVQGGNGGLTPDGAIVSIKGGDSYVSDSVSVRRTVSTSYDVPLPSFQNPLDLSWKRCVSAIALVQQRFK